MKLRRWLTRDSTAGVWLFADHPGCGVSRTIGGWTVFVERSPLWRDALWSFRVWGEYWGISERDAEAVESLRPVYPTRAAAIHAFEAALSDAPASALSEALS